jgi:peroxiredoxin
MRRRSAALVLIATIVALLQASTADARRHASGTGLAPIAFNKRAPNFAFDVATGPASLDGLRGRTIVLNFWATYCEPCTEELDSFGRLRGAFGDDVALVMVSDQPHDLTDALLKSRGIDAISLADPDRKIFALYGVTPIPATLVIAPDGTVRYVSIGELDWAELQAAVAATRPPAPSAAPTPAAT